jgi:NAD(P)-dependent dehydrogenase (short-subunit alcohol dehydrogenase family)
MRMKDDEWDQVISVNLEAAFRLIRAATKPMMKARFGRDRSRSPRWWARPVIRARANYAASKAGLVGMSKALAQELASRNVTVNCVAPGFISSAMTDGLPEAQKEPLARQAFRPASWATGERHCRSRRLSGQPGGILCDRPDVTRQRRDGDDLMMLRLRLSLPTSSKHACKQSLPPLGQATETLRKV